jgi:hypothetical protein
MPSMTRLVRRIAACLAAAALAFAQLAVSAYACPSQDRASAAVTKHQTAEENCAKTATRNLCERHCDYGDSLQSAPPAVTAPDLAPLPWRIELVAAPAVERRACRSLAPPRIEPPPLVRFGVLRI